MKLINARFFNFHTKKLCNELFYCSCAHCLDYPAPSDHYQAREQLYRTLSEFCNQAQIKHYKSWIFYGTA